MGLPLVRLENSQNKHFSNKEIDQSGLPPVRLQNNQIHDFLKKETDKSWASSSQAEH